MKRRVQETATLLDALIDALQRAGTYNKNDQAQPAAVLWPDKDRQWERLLPLLRERLPLLTFNEAHYAPAERTGPAYWVRCMLARTLEDDQLPPDATPIIYLPGVSKQELRAVEECPKPLQPLAELQYRGVVWTHKNGRDWTVAGFLQSSDSGLGVEVGTDTASREALLRTLVKLAHEPVARLRKEAPLRAPFFDALLNPDEVRSILLWLNDSEGYRKQQSEAEWSAFVSLCKNKYGFHPDKDGVITAAQLLGHGAGNWAMVWHRYSEAPHTYPNLPDMLRRARPQQLSLFEKRYSWPQDNEEEEQTLRIKLRSLDNLCDMDARAIIGELEEHHALRRDWVWFQLGLSPLVHALEHLVALGTYVQHTLYGTASEIAQSYATWGWQADAAVIDALASVEHPDDVTSVKAAITAIYRPWLEAVTTAFQQAVAAGDIAQTYPRTPLPTVQAGTCLLFCDALRFDAGQRLCTALTDRGYTCHTIWHLAALPTITATAKPAISPVTHLFRSSSKTGLEPVISASGASFTADGLRKLLIDTGYQILKGDDTGDPTGKAWIELGMIDSYGHQHGWEIARHLLSEVRALAWRIDTLLNAGWQQITVITDHGWLMLPHGLPKADLPEHLTLVRKGRCARLKADASTNQQTVPWHWDAEVRIAVAPGICCYEAGKEYDHGGLSPQECVVPIITVSRPAHQAQNVTIASVVWRGLRCTVTLTGGTTGMSVDLRTKANDPLTSLAAAPKALVPDGTASLLVEDESHEGEAALIVILTADGSVVTQTLTTVGG